MAEEKVTTMVLDVDLQCSKCYKKVKKLLCKFPQIRDQTYDEKANKVTIKVVCCSPEKIRDKLCSKGRGSIKSIEIKEPKKTQKKKPDQPPANKQEEQTKPDDSEKKKKEADLPKPVAPRKDPSPPPVPVPVTLALGFCCEECYNGRPGGPCRRAGPPPVPVPVPVPFPFPLGFCCDECYSGRPGGPCWRGGRFQCDGYYGRPVCTCWGRCICGYASYCTEEIQQGCTIT